MIGTKLGPYEITAKLGEGGMGEVFRAIDTRLKREVAIKVLPAAFTADKERLARFEREAQLLAQLHHPNIAAIFGLEESGGVLALVMELVEGPTLAERMATGPIAVDEVVAIAAQVAQALEEAHEKGIVHRDLKPQNVKVTGDGKVKVLDFGLAKAMSAESGSHSMPALANSPTLTHGATVEGMILGTAAYMSPEQAKGKPVDKRADIWAFGVVLFEMLCGRKLFEAETLAETLGAVFRQEIDLDELPAATPPPLRRLIARCLERDPRQRLRDVGEARIALEAIAGGEVEPVGASIAGGRRGMPMPWVAALGIGVAAIGVLLVWSSMRGSAASDPPPPKVTEFAIEVEGLGSSAISPDGRRLCWLSGKRGEPGRALWVRDLDSRAPRRIVSDPDLGFSFWSPDGEALAVVVGEKLWRYPAAGGEGVPICDFPKLEGVPAAFAISGAWLEDGTIFFGAWRGGIYRVPARGGIPELAMPFDPEVEVDFHRILLLPDGESLLLEVHRQRGVESTEATPEARIELYRDGRRSPLEGGDTLVNVDLVGYALGTLLVTPWDERAQPIWGVPFDAERGTVQGKRFVALAARAASASAAADGTLAYVAPKTLPGVVVRVDRDGAEVRRLGKEQPDLGDPSPSPDGSRLAVTRKSTELWVEDLVRETSTRLVEADDEIYLVQWSADGRTLYYCVAGRSRRFRRIRADPGATPETVLDGVDLVSIAPDGGGILFQKASYALKSDQGLFWVALDAMGRAGEPKKVLDGIGTFGRLSPDGRLLAFRRFVGRGGEAFVARFPSLDQTIQLSSNGGEAPQWNPDGRSVFFNSGSELVQVDVGFDAQGRLTASPEQRLFDVAKAGLRPAEWAVAPDGKGFLFIKPLESDRPSELVVVRNGLQRAIAETR